MLCSSGFSRLSYGSPYWMPTARSAAAPARIAASAVAAPPQRASAQRPTGVLDLRRRVADELGDVSRSDDDRIDSSPLELDDLLAARRVDRGDRELARRHVRQQVERVLPLVALPVGGEQEDLGVDAVQRVLQLVLVGHANDA